MNKILLSISMCMSVNAIATLRVPNVLIFTTIQTSAPYLKYNIMLDEKIESSIEKVAQVYPMNQRQEQIANMRYNYASSAVYSALLHVAFVLVFLATPMYNLHNVRRDASKQKGLSYGLLWFGFASSLIYTCMYIYYSIQAAKSPYLTATQLKLSAIFGPGLAIIGCVIVYGLYISKFLSK